MRNKQITAIALAAMMLAGSACAAKPGEVNFVLSKEAPAVKKIAKAPKTLLVVGNSYTYYNCGLNGYLSNFLIGDAIASGDAKDEKSARKLFKTRIAAIGRGNLSQYPIAEYLDNAIMKSHVDQAVIEEKYLAPETKKREKYDLVLMQASNRPEADQARDSYYIPEHVKAIRAQGGEPALIMTWVQKNKNAPKIELVRDATVKIANANKMMVIPVGLAFDLAEKKFPQVTLIRTDNTHPTAAGSFLEAATIYAAVYKKDPFVSQSAFWKTLCDHSLDPAVREKLCAAAVKTVNDFYGEKIATKASFEAGAVKVKTADPAAFYNVKPAVKHLGLKNPTRGLYVGNSYTYYNCGIGAYVKGFINKEQGEEWKTRMQTISAGRLYQHPIERYFDKDDAVLKDYNRPNKPKFDVVFLQGQSREPYQENKKDPANAPKVKFEKALKHAIAVVRENGSVPVVVSTWASKKSPAGYDMRSETIALADATIKLANDNKAIVLPVGIAFETVRAERPDLNLHNKSDLKHPSAEGSYLFGAMIYSMLFEKSPEWVGSKWLGECDKPIKAEDAEYLQNVAWRVTKQFYGWK